MDNAFGHWFAGFVDGEGHFGMSRRGVNGTGYACSFSLIVRADDAEVMEKIHRWLGVGRLYRYKFIRRKDQYANNPRCELHVTKREEVRKLIDIFDRFPLRAKKARDYRIWREAVLLWADRKSHRGGAGRSAHPVQSRLAELKAELEAARTFKE